MREKVEESVCVCVREGGRCVCVRERESTNLFCLLQFVVASSFALSRRAQSEMGEEKI